MLLALLLQISLCQNRVTDKVARPMQSFVVDAATFQNITANPVPGQPFIDPSFGTVITRITDASGADGSQAVIKTMYSTMQAWNADESRAILWNRKDGHVLYNGEEPYQKIGLLNPFHPTDIEQLLWDPVDPNVLYYPTNYNASPWLIKQTLDPNESRVIHDFGTPPTNCPGGDWGKLLKLGSDPQWMGYGPRKIVGLQCGSLKFLYSITEDAVLVSGSADTPNAPIVGPSDTLTFFEGYVFDVGFRFLRSLGMVNPGEHSSMGRDAVGHDRWNAVVFDGPTYTTGSLVSWDLTTGVPKIVVGPETGWPPPGSATHLSAIARQAPGWVAVGTVGGIPWGQGVLQNEIILGNVDTGEVCRLAHARTKAGTDCGPAGDQCKWGYWGETHPVISPKGTRILYSSDWGGSDSVNTYVIDLRKPRVRATIGMDCSLVTLSPLQVADCTVTSFVPKR